MKFRYIIGLVPILLVIIKASADVVGTDTSDQETNSNADATEIHLAAGIRLNQTPGWQAQPYKDGWKYHQERMKREREVAGDNPTGDDLNKRRPETERDPQNVELDRHRAVAIFQPYTTF